MRAPSILIASLLCAASAWAATTIDTTIDLDRVGANMSLAAEANGDLHLVWRAGDGANPSNYNEIRYLHYTASNDTWHFPSVQVVKSSAQVSPDIDTNQPRIATDPTVAGRAYLIFGADFTVPHQPTIVQIDTAIDARGQITATNRLGTTQEEIKSVGVAVTADGRPFGCNTYVDVAGNPSKNGVYCYQGPSWTKERATLQQGAGEGLSLAPMGSSSLQAASTFGSNQNNAVFSIRDSLSAGIWTPGPDNFNIPAAAGKIRLLPTGANTTSVYAITALTFINGAARDLLYLPFQGGQPLSTTPLHLARYYYLGPAAYPSQGGDLYSSEDLDAARSPAGREVVAFGMDGSEQLIGVPPNPSNDFGVLLVKAPGSSWPTGFVDGTDEDQLCVCGEPGCGTTNCDKDLASCDDLCDGFDDRVVGSYSLDYVRLLNGPFPYLAQGTEGREVIALDSAETMAVAFSGEALWVAYYEGKTKKARLSRVRFAPPVPELPTSGLLLLTLGFSVLLLRGARRRPALAAGALLALTLGACGDTPGDGGGGGTAGLKFTGSELALGKGGIDPDMAVTSEGNLHLVYRGELTRGDNAVYYQFYKASSQKWTTAARLDDAGHSLARSTAFGSPRVAALPTGGATVVWAEFPDPGNSVWARDIGADGTPQGLFIKIHGEAGIAVEQHDVAVDASGTTHYLFGLIGQGQDGVYHKTRPQGGNWPGTNIRRRVFSAGRKFPVIEANPSASGSPRLWAAWRYRNLEYCSFDGNNWSEAKSVAAPQNLSIGDPAITVRPDGQPLIGTSPFQTGAVNRSTYVHQPGVSDPLLQIDIVTLSSTGVVDVAVNSSGASVIVWDRFVLGVRNGVNILSEIASIDPSKDKVINRRRICYKLSDAAGKFQAIPDADNSNAFTLPLDSDTLGEQSYPVIKIHGNSVDLVYLDGRNPSSPQFYHRRASLP